MDLPDNIVLDQLPGLKRGEYPALYISDDVAWSPQRTHLALAYTITEASMCNEVGSILWARVDVSKATILQNPIHVRASCWQSPWCRWLSEETFVFKSNSYNGQTNCLPLVAIHVTKGFQVLPGTSIVGKWLDDVPPIGDEWFPFHEEDLLKQIHSHPIKPIVRQPRKVAMTMLIRREFKVNLPLEKAWQHLARVEQWPSWAKHIKQVRVQPKGELGSESQGRIHLSNGIKTAFRMTEFNPYRNWKWTGGFLWLTVDYDHRFEELNSTQTKLTWVVEAKGFGVPVFGKLFAKIYNKNLDRAIPLLVEEMNSSNS